MEHSETVAQSETLSKTGKGPHLVIAQKILAIAKNPNAHQSFCSLIDQGLVSGTNFLTVVIIGRYCLPEELGIYHLLFSIILMSYLLQDSLISGPYRIYLKKHSLKDQPKYTGSVFIHQLASSLLMVGTILGVMVASLLGYVSEELAMAAVPLLFLSPFIMMRDFLRRISFAHLQIRVAILLDLTAAVLQICSLYLLAFNDLLTVTNAYLAIGGSCLISCGVWYLSSPIQRIFSRSDLIKDWLHNWKFSRWSLGSMMVANLPPVLFLPWLLAFSDGETATGILAASFMIVGVVNVFLSAIENMLGPRSAHELHDNGAKRMMFLLNRATLILSIVMLFFVFGLGIWGQTLALFVFGEQYLEHGQVMAWVIFIQSVHFLGVAIGIGATNGLWALERPNDNFFSSLGDMLVTIVLALLFVLILPFGPIGVALATAAGTITGTILRWYFLKRTLNPNLLAAATT